MAVPCLCEDDAKAPTSACVDHSFEANGVLNEAFDLHRGESCADVLGSAGGHGGITAAELCRMSLSDFASNLAAGYSLAGAVTYTPPSGYTYVVDICAATCGGHGIGATACGGSGSVSPVSASIVTTTTTAELRTRLAHAPLVGCDYYWGPMGPVTYVEDMWTIRCGSASVIWLGSGTFSLGGAQVRQASAPDRKLPRTPAPGKRDTTSHASFSCAARHAFTHGLRDSRPPRRQQHARRAGNVAHL